MQRWISGFSSWKCSANVVRRYASTAVTKGKILKQERSRTSRVHDAHGQAIAHSTAERYSIQDLRQRLYANGLLGNGDDTDAMNVLGEAIWIPQWPVSAVQDSSEQGEIFIFESGSFVTWNMSEDSGKSFRESVLSGKSVQLQPYKEPQTEAMDFIVQTGGKTGVTDDLIVIATRGEASNEEELESRNGGSKSARTSTRRRPESETLRWFREMVTDKETSEGQEEVKSQLEESIVDSPRTGGETIRPLSTFPQAQPESQPVLHRINLSRDEDDLRVRLSLSMALARSTKLAVYEEMLDEFMGEFSSVPSQLIAGSEAPLSKKQIIQHTGQLLLLRQYLNLNTIPDKPSSTSIVGGENLLDAPEFFWNISINNSQNLETIFKELTRALEVRTRLDNLNRKLDYSLQFQQTLSDLKNTKVSHRLEWIIIILIAIEIMLVLIREGLPGFESHHAAKKRDREDKQV